MEKDKAAQGPPVATVKWDVQNSKDSKAIEAILLKHLPEDKLKAFVEEEPKQEFLKDAAGKILAEVKGQIKLNWNIVIGEILVTCLALHESDAFGHFTCGNLNVVMFSTSRATKTK